MKIYEYDSVSKTVKFNSIVLNISSLQFNPQNVSDLLTSLDGILVLWEYENKFIYYVDIKANKVIGSVEMNEPMGMGKKVISLPNTNDLIVVNSNSIYYLQMTKNNELLFTINKKLLKKYQSEDIWIKLNGAYLTINIFEEERFEICKIEDSLKDKKELNHTISVNTNISENSVISTNQKYFIVETTRNQLIVYKLEKMKILGYLKFNASFNVISSDDYISISIDNSLLSYKII